MKILQKSDVDNNTETDSEKNESEDEMVGLLGKLDEI